MSKQYDLLLRLLVIGDSGVGKTCLLCRYVDDQFYPSYAATIGIDFKTMSSHAVVQHMLFAVLSEDTVSRIMDTAGQERFETITKQYYRRAQGVLLMYDISNHASFDHLNKWLQFLRQHAQDNVEITVIGNKTDLDEWRQVKFGDGARFAQKYAFGFYESSAYMDPRSLDEVFTELVGRILVNQAESLARQRLDMHLSSDSEDDGEIRVYEASSPSGGKCC